MLFYVINLILIFLYWLFIKHLHKNCRRENVVFLSLVFIHLFIIEGFRSLDFGQDSWYQDLYRGTASLSWNQVLRFNEYLFFKAEIGYVAFNKLLNYVSNDVHILYIAVSAIYLTSVCRLLKKYSYMPIISVFLFFIVFWFQSFYVLRQYIALSFVMASIPFIINRNFVGFGLLLIVAFFFHQSSVVFVPIYFLFNYHFRLTLKTTLMFILCTIVITLAINSVFRIAVETLSGYDSYLDSETSSDGNFKMAIVYLFYLLSYAFFSLKNKSETLTDNLFVKLLCIAFILQFAGSNFVLMQRLNVYFSFSLMMVIPNIIKAIKSQPLKYAFIAFTIILYSYIMVLDFEKDRYSVTPYSSIIF